MTGEVFIDEKQEAVLTAQLEQEFRDDCSDKLERLSTCLESIAEGTDNSNSHIAEISMLAHSLKGMAAAFGYPGISMVAHRLEDYLATSETYNQQDIQNIYRFADQIQTLQKLKIQPDNNAISNILRELPEHSSLEQTQENNAFEALVIMPNTVQRRFIQKELASAGFRMTSANTSFEAIELTVRLLPDLVLVSAIMDELEGVEIANILRAAKATKEIPIVIVTSLEGKDIPSDLPDKTFIANKGENFSKDLAQCLSRIEI